MALVRSVLETLKSSDGRIGIRTLSGVSMLVAVIALLVGVLPVFASHPAAGVDPVPLDEGGGSGKCSVITGGLPSAAGNEFHINNPVPGSPYISGDGLITVVVHDTVAAEEPPAGRLFDFNVNGNSVLVYDVVVNGGPKSLHYDYDAGDGDPVDSGDDLHAPAKNARTLHNLSHINICYDVPGMAIFACGEPVRLDSEGLFTDADASIFANSVLGCTDGKRALFTIDNTDTEEAEPTVTLEFQGDTGVDVAGRLDVTKEFSDPSQFVDLTYDRVGLGSFVPVPWCDTRPFAAGDGTQFSEWLPTTGDDASYPDLPDEETACKVAENEDVSGTQVTVMYFELEDPQWR